MEYVIPLFPSCQARDSIHQEGINTPHMNIINTIDRNNDIWQNVTVKTLEMLYKSLALIKRSSEKPVLQELVTKETKDKTIIEKKELPTRDLFAQEFGVSIRAALDDLAPLKEYGLIEQDMNRSYYVSSKTQKTWKWVFKLSKEGEDFFNHFPTILKEKMKEQEEKESQKSSG
jgi:DNA-binding transcriptional regulator YhcF (GntR family)